jgi:uncharacterized repeat protein (TIGR01451 family)
MRLSRRLHALSNSSDGRGRLTTLASILVLASLLVLVLAVLPAGADFPDSAAGVTPATVNLGGQPNDCDALGIDGLPSVADYELRIENPRNQVYSLPAIPGATVELAIRNDKFLDFEFTGAAGFDVIIKGGQKSTHWDYDGTIGPTLSDEELHAPQKGNGSNLYSISHVSLCYDEIPEADLSVTKAASDETPNEGVEVTYTITATNGGPSPATNVVVTDRLPDGVTLVGNSSNVVQGSFDENTGVWTIGSLALDAEATLTYRVTIDEETSGRSLINTATITTGALDPNRENDIDEVTLTVNFCGQQLSWLEGPVFVAYITIFDQGNSEQLCDGKYGELFETEEEVEDGTVAQLNFRVFGDGTFAAFGDINKSFSSPNDFVPLRYKQGDGDPSFEVVPWCGLRPKSGIDGIQFDDFLLDDTMYPTLTDIYDPDSGEAAVSCKVFEGENAEGNQQTILLIQGDPFFR